MLKLRSRNERHILSIDYSKLPMITSTELEAISDSGLLDSRDEKDDVVHEIWIKLPNGVYTEKVHVFVAPGDLPFE